MGKEIVIKMTPAEVQKIVAYLMTKPWGEVWEVMDLLRTVDQRALKEAEDAPSETE